jgi:hypothetical protein
MQKRIIKPSETSDYLVFGLLCLTWGILLGGAYIYDNYYLSVRRENALLDFTNEILSSHSDRQACYALATNQRLLNLPDFEIIQLWADEAREQLDDKTVQECTLNGPLGR